jgi:hypothetical protein
VSGFSIRGEARAAERSGEIVGVTRMKRSEVRVTSILLRAMQSREPMEADAAIPLLTEERLEAAS